MSTQLQKRQGSYLLISLKQDELLCPFCFRRDTMVAQLTSKQPLVVLPALLHISESICRILTRCRTLKLHILHQRLSISSPKWLTRSTYPGQPYIYETSLRLIFLRIGMAARRERSARLSLPRASHRWIAPGRTNAGKWPIILSRRASTFSGS